MRRLLIVGAGGFGREVLGWALEQQKHQREWIVAGFLDSNPLALNGYNVPYKILGDPNTFVTADNDRFICAIGDPATKLRVAGQVRSHGGRFVNLIHPTAVIGPDCSLGEGCIICPNAVLTTHVRLDSFVTVNVGACVGHDAQIGTGCTLSPHVDINGHAVVGEGVFLGTHASILPSAIVGNYAIVGAGSVVLRKVQPRTTVLGVPARQVTGFTEDQHQTSKGTINERNHNCD
jgi:sugar O-acyltransferase (sialic acid O-acetyltransferase NeuD family)